MFLFTPGDPVVTKIWTEFDIDTSPHVVRSRVADLYLGRRLSGMEDERRHSLVSHARRRRIARSREGGFLYRRPRSVARGATTGNLD
jgi:hypothetical protein